MKEGGEEEFKSLGVGYKEKTIFGGLLAFVAWAILLAEFGLTMNLIFLQRDNDYTLNEIFQSPEEMQDMFSLGDFESGNFLFGIDVVDLKETGFDLLNNPYVEYYGSNWQFDIGSDHENRHLYEIEECSQE